MFERFFGGKQKEAVVTNEKMLANELRTPKGSYFNNLKTIVAALTLAGFILPLASIDKAVAGPPRETKQMSEVNPQTETGQRKMAELLQKIKNEKGLDITMAGGHFVGTQEQTKEIVQIESAKKIYQEAYQKAKENQTPYQEVAFATENQPVALENFLNALGVKINPEVQKVLDQADYRAVFCCQDASTTNKGLFLKTKPLNTPEEFTRVTKQMGKSLPSWEPNMINDLKNIFFPGSEFKETPEFQKVPYRDKYGFMTLSLQYANIKDTAGANHYFGYVYWDEMLFISNNQDCLKKMTDAHSPEPGL